MFITIWFVMAYTLTGNFLHELLGIALILFFLLHIIVNRRYYFAMPKQFFNKDVNIKIKASFVINVLLFAASVAILICVFFNIILHFPMLLSLINLVKLIMSLMCVPLSGNGMFAGFWLNYLFLFYIHVPLYRL